MINTLQKTNSRQSFCNFKKRNKVPSRNNKRILRIPCPLQRKNSKRFLKISTTRNPLKNLANKTKNRRKRLLPHNRNNLTKSPAKASSRNNIFQK